METLKTIIEEMGCTYRQGNAANELFVTNEAGDEAIVVLHTYSDGAEVETMSKNEAETEMLPPESISMDMGDREDVIYAINEAFKIDREYRGE